MTSIGAWELVEPRLVIEGLSPQTIATKRRQWLVFDRWLATEKGPSFDLRRITMKDVSRFLSFLDHGRIRPMGAAYSRHVKAALIDLVRRAFDILVDEGRLLTNPWARVSVERGSSKPRRIPSPTEVAHLLDSIVPEARGHGLSPTRNLRDRALFELLYATGVRLKEAGSLRWEDVDLEKRMVHVRSTKVKRDRVVPVTKASLAWLSSWKEGLRDSGSLRLRLRSGPSAGLLDDHEALQVLARTRRLHASSERLFPPPCLRLAPSRRRRRSSLRPGPPRA